MFSIQSFAKSLTYAGKGILRVVKEEQSFRVQLLVAAAVAALMVFFDMSALERAFLTLAITLVLVLELINSIFERMVDALKPRIHHYVEDIKDIMAGTVLVASIGAAVIGLLILFPYALAVVKG